MSATPEQQAVVDHPLGEHGRVLAGPGTGKSWVSVALVERLARERPDIRVRLVTFTRAATSELARKMGEADLGEAGVPAPSTIHSFALGLLMRAGGAGLPEPLRIPDSWELRKLIRPDLGRRLKERGYIGGSSLVFDLEQELAAGWQSLDPAVLILADVDPGLRAAYVGLWNQHRVAFGCSLLAELPYRAGQGIEDRVIEPEALDLLIVDEYQDLNEADIRLLSLLADRGARVLSVGDDDQSIYSFRKAAPEGIRRFLDEFKATRNYSLTIGLRCGSAIIDAAATLIESSTDRLPRPRLRARDGAAAGQFAYARFNNETAEVEGVARIVAARLGAGVSPANIAILVRSNAETWAAYLAPALAERGVSVRSVSWVDDALEEREMRVGLSIARLAVNTTDSLAWWGLLQLERGVSRSFVEYVYEARLNGETFADALLRLSPVFDGAPTAQSARAAQALVDRVSRVIDAIALEGAVLDETGWGGWVLGQMNREGLSGDCVRLLEDVGAVVPASDGLGGFLAQLQPVGKDLASSGSDHVRIMTMTASKGLTLDTVVVMGVEDGIIPLPPPRGKPDEELRLLYVAMTRATDLCVLTWAGRRRGPTARHGEANVAGPRRRSPLLADLPIGKWIDGMQVVAALEAGLRE